MGSGRETTTGTAQTLSRRPPFAPACLMMGAEHCAVDHLNRIRHRLADNTVVDPKFSSWVKEVLCQVVDVDPITVFGNFDNG